MKLDIDLSKVETLKRLPDGIFALRLLEVKEAESQAGNVKLNLHLEILAPASVRDKITKKFFTSLTLVEEALFRVKEFTDAIGLSGPAAIDTANWLGKEVGARVSFVESKEFGEQNRVLKWIPIKETKPALIEMKKKKVNAEARVG